MFVLDFMLFSQMGSLPNLANFPQKWSRRAMWYHTNTMWDHTTSLCHYPKPPTRIHLWICKLLPKKVQQWQKLPSGQVSSSFNDWIWVCSS